MDILRGARRRLSRRRPTRVSPSAMTWTRGTSHDENTLEDSPFLGIRAAHVRGGRVAKPEHRDGRTLDEAALRHAHATYAVQAHKEVVVWCALPVCEHHDAVPAYGRRAIDIQPTSPLFLVSFLFSFCLCHVLNPQQIGQAATFTDYALFPPSMFDTHSALEDTTTGPSSSWSARRWRMAAAELRGRPREVLTCLRCTPSMVDVYYNIHRT